MKRTDQERIERELRRREKRDKVKARRDKDGDTKATPGAYIKDLFGLLQYDEHQIYNTQDDEDIFELLLNMKSDLEEKHWDSVLRGAIRKTKVAEKETAFTELKALLAE
jgi:hypothetical protein